MVARIPRLQRVSLYVAMLLISLLVLEAGFRAVLAFRIGPSVLYFGTRFQRQTVPAATENHTVMQLHPDVVTFYEGVNDAARGNPSTSQEDRKHAVHRRRSHR